MAYYPYVSLSKAIELTRKIYDKEQFRAVRKDDSLAITIGYGSVNGSSDATLSAMVNYGLLDETDDHYFKVTRLALNIIQNNAGNPERIAAIIEAVSRIEVFDELKAEFGERDVSENSLTAYFQEKNVTHRRALRTAKVYRATMEFVERETQKDRPFIYSRARGNNRMNLEAHENASTALAQQDSNQEAFSIPIDKDFKVQLIFKGELTDDRIETLIEYLRIMQKRFSGRQQSRFSDQDDIE
jgi:hypothetical protein